MDKLSLHNLIFTKSTLLILILGVLFQASAVAESVGGATSPLCIEQEEHGNWVNINSNTRSITRINVDFFCRDTSLNGQLPAGFSFYLNLFGACHPRDCDWGEVGANRDRNGWIRTTIDHGFAVR